MAGSLIPSAKQRFYDASGRPLVGGKVTTYAAGTTSKKTTFQDRALTAANTNPVILDGRGEAVMYGTGVYRFVVSSSTGVLIYDRDNIEAYGSVLDAINVDTADVIAARAAAIVSIDADVAAADAYRIAGQSLIDTDTAALDAYRIAGQVLIDADVAAVDARKLQAVNTDIPAILTTLAAFNERGAWAPGTSYALKDIYVYQSIAYVVTLAHTSSTVAADLASGKVAIHQGATKQELAASSGAGLVGVAGGRTQAQHNANMLHMRDYVVADGVTDDTVAATAVHVAANTSGATVSYSGIIQIALQANALIPVKASVDFCGAEIVILGGVAGTPSFSTFNTLFVVTDDACPLVNVVGAVSASNLTVGAIFPTLGLFDGHGFAKLTCGLQVPDRNKTGTINYTQTFKVNRNGRVSHPLSVDISAYASAITVDYRKTSKKRLRLDNLSLTEGSWNNQRIFRISRCNVEVNNFTMLFDSPGTAFNNICELISIDNASDILVNLFNTTGRPVSTTVGSYCLAIYGGADIYVDRMNALTGWGAVGTDDINGLHFTRSVINRIDCHSSGHNIFADDCDLHEAGVVYGWGGGVLSVKNSRAYRCSVIATREDYGGTFFGSLIVDNVETSNNFTSTYTVIDLANNALGASTPVFAPVTIEVANLRRVGKATANSAELIPIAIKVLNATSVVYAPISIKATNITCAHAWRFGLRIDILNMEGSSSLNGYLTRIMVSDCYPESVANGAASVLTSGILDYDSLRTPTNAVRPMLKVSDSDHIAARIRNPINVDIRMSNTGINAIVVNTDSATKPTVVIDACRLLSPAAGFSVAPIGASTSGANGYTILRDCEIAGLFDLSLAAALQGNTIRTGANQPTLPATVTAALAFSGWQKSGAFS